MSREGERNRGLFITFEGIEGVGKSTQCKRMADYLRTEGRRVVETREPGGTTIGEQIRRILLDQTYPGMSQMTELLLLFAARAEHLHKVILPALAAGQWVVCDRFTDASYAYQGAGRGMPSSHIGTLEVLVQGDLRPDLTLLLDAPVALALERMSHRGGQDRFETEREVFFQRVRRGYLQQAQRNPERFHIIDATPPMDEVTAQIQLHIDKLLRCGNL